MTEGHLITPKVEENMLAVCPPPPRAPHKALDWNSLNLSRSFGDNEPSSDENPSPSRPPSLKLIYDGVKTKPQMWLKPRPSKEYSPPLPSVDTTFRSPAKLSSFDRQETNMAEGYLTPKREERMPVKAMAWNRGSLPWSVSRSFDNNDTSSIECFHSVTGEYSSHKSPSSHKRSCVGIIATLRSSKKSKATKSPSLSHAAQMLWPN